ncbi:MAG TPA: YhjD/YihY/BrkB family envelope integrity protein [Haliangiales bacterium]|nr:YhjD/YihY/BrkB family envelope integrity protein [Haliangiales bacterium]
MAKDSVSQIKKLQAEAQVLLDDRGIAGVDEAQLHPFKKFVHFWVLVGKTFVRNRCLVRASALAYTTLLALIPLLAVGLGVSTTLLNSSRERTSELIGSLIDQLAPQLGMLPTSEQDKGEERKKLLERVRESLAVIAKSNERERTALIDKLAGETGDRRPGAVERIRELLPDFTRGSDQQKAELVNGLVDEWRPDLANSRRKIVKQIQEFIANVHSGALGLTGTVGFFFVAIGLLSTIEATFNDIWGVTRGRNWFVRVIHYWAAITLGPLVIILVMGLAIGSQFQAVQNLIKDTPVVGGLLFKLIPFFILCGAFMLLYQLMPNTRVHWKAALVGGLVAGTLWIANGNFNALFASRVVSASKIYGSLAAIPIFLFGIYLSWTILLFGAQVSYAYQNRRAYIQEKQAESVNQRGREFIALRVMTLVGQKFHHGEMPPTANEIAESLSVSSRLIGQILQPLLQTKLVVEVATPETAYCPARPLDKISYEDIILSLRAGQGQEPATREEPSRELVRGALEEIQQAERRVSKAVTLQAMVERTATLAAENTTPST